MQVYVDGNSVSIIFHCVTCGTTGLVVTKPSRFKNPIKKFCSKRCQAEAFKTMFRGENNPMYGKVARTKKTHPEWAASISKTMTEKGNMLGDKNPMKDPEVAARMSKTRREKVTSDPEYRKARSECMKQLWADGHYDDVPVGKCKWYDHVKSDGTIVKCQGTWELAFAQWMDKQHLTYTMHRGRMKYTDDDGQEHTYYPDAYVNEWECYVDVKSDYHHSLQPMKLEWVRRSNPDVEVRLLGKEELDEMGVL